MTSKGVSIVSGLCVVLAALGFSNAAAGAESVVWLTSPSDIRQLSFVRPGMVGETLVKEGDTVEAGALLVRQEDAVEQQELRKLELVANDEVRIRFAEVALEQAILDRDKYQEAFDQGNVTMRELEHAKLEVKKNQASLDIAKLDKQQAVTDRDQMKARLDQMRITSPIAGRIERLQARKGVAVNAMDPVVVVVCTDPLWADVPVSFDQARDIKIGDTAPVVFLSSGEGAPATGAADDSTPPADAVNGTVIYKATVADLAGKITVRIEFPNPEGIPARGHVKVWFKAGQ